MLVTGLDTLSACWYVAYACYRSTFGGSPESFLWGLAMLRTLWAVIRRGRIEPVERVDLPEGARALVTLLPDGDTEFWLQTTQGSVDAIWDNTEDDVYAQLLEK